MSGIYGNYCTQPAWIKSLTAHMPVDVYAKHNMPLVQVITISWSELKNAELPNHLDLRQEKRSQHTDCMITYLPSCIYATAQTVGCLQTTSAMVLHACMMHEQVKQADLVIRGAPAIVVAINGIHFKGVCGPLSLHGRLYIIMPIECDCSLTLITA